MKQCFTIEQVKPNIFLFSFKDYYDMAMHFLRYQEYYESTSPKFRSKSFEIFDFMRWYSKKYGKDAFTYPKDWGGFNIPSNIIFDMWNEHKIIDKNKYDYAMWNAWQECYSESDKKQFYIIGAVGKGVTLKHEIAHGFFYTVPEYKKEMIALVKALPFKLRKSINKTLSKMGYTAKVFVDETQAYMATGFSVLCKENPKLELKLKKARAPFIKAYKKYYI